MKSSSSSLDSLVDTGDNGGVLGSDARVIEAYADCNVDAHGIDNHEITSIHMETAGGVT